MASWWKYLDLLEIVAKSLNESKDSILYRPVAMNSQYTERRSVNETPLVNKNKA